MNNHVCAVCARPFISNKKSQRTCGWSCRGKFARATPNRRVCACGEPVLPMSRYSYCAKCSLERKRQARRDFYRRHQGAILFERRVRYAESSKVRAAVKAAISKTANKRRFNGLRLERLELDGIKCTECGATEKLVVHHNKRLDPSGERKDTESTIDVLLTLCRKCHMNLHRQLGHLG